MPDIIPFPEQHSSESSTKSSIQDGNANFAALPFVRAEEEGYKYTSNWHVPPTDSYSHACKTGREYAAHFAQYLKDSPDMCGANTLGIIARDIDFKNTSATAGYWVGFFSYLESIITAQTRQLDVFGDVAKVNVYYAERDAQIPEAEDDTMDTV